MATPHSDTPRLERGQWGAPWLSTSAQRLRGAKAEGHPATQGAQGVPTEPHQRMPWNPLNPLVLLEGGEAATHKRMKERNGGGCKSRAKSKWREAFDISHYSIRREARAA